MTDKPSGPCCKRMQEAVQARKAQTLVAALTRAAYALIRSPTRRHTTYRMADAPCKFCGGGVSCDM
jgi:hypothetical protein